MVRKEVSFEFEEPASWLQEAEILHAKKNQEYIFGCASVILSKGFSPVKSSFTKKCFKKAHNEEALLL